MISKGSNSELVQTAYDEGMKTLNEFWELGWTKNTPEICIVSSRAEINKIKGRETENWVIGWGDSSDPKHKKIYLLDFEKIATESSHRIEREEYKTLIVHELCHLFVATISEKTSPIGPMWWNEGLSTFLSGQLKYKKRPEKLIGFLDSNRENPRPAYNEGGFVIETLINKLGKGKIIKLAKALAGIKSEKFGEKFEEIYGFKLRYEEINKLYSEN